MTLKEFKTYISSFPQGTTFTYGISEPHSFRGIFSDVAFDMLEQPMTREEILERIELTYTQTFNGYKGGTYEYDDNTDIHFEDVHEWVAKIEAKKPYFSEEERLVNLAFPSKEY